MSLAHTNTHGDLHGDGFEHQLGKVRQRGSGDPPRGFFRSAGAP